MVDELWDAAKFDLVEGSLQYSVSFLEVGRSVDYKYVVIPKAGQQGFLAPAAKVTYRGQGQKQTHTLHSTKPYVPVLSKAQNIEIYLVRMVRHFDFPCSFVRHIRYK